MASGYNRGTIHAEVRALKKMWPNWREGSTVYSIRFTKGGRFGLAKPCPACEAYMRENGVKDVWYSLPNGEMARMKL